MCSWLVYKGWLASCKSNHVTKKGGCTRDIATVRYTRAQREHTREWVYLMGSVQLLLFIQNSNNSFQQPCQLFLRGGRHTSFAHCPRLHPQERLGGAHFGGALSAHSRAHERTHRDPRTRLATASRKVGVPRGGNALGSTGALSACPGATQHTQDIPAVVDFLFRSGLLPALTRPRAA